MKKELKTGVISLAAIGLLVGGVNFLKGNSFFGGDNTFSAYFPSSGGLAPATSVYVNGVPVGKVLSLENNYKGDSLSKVKVSFNIQDENLKIPKGSKFEIGSFDMFNKGLLIYMSSEFEKGYYRPGDMIKGDVAQDMMAQVKSYADPITQKLQGLMSNVDKTITSLQGFWDKTATSEIEKSMFELKNAINRFGNVAIEVEGLVASEKIKLSRIFSNVESISSNLKESNDKIEGIIGNAKKMTDDLVSVEYKSVILDAQTTIKKLNMTLDEVNNGNGSIGKLLKDQSLYNELVNTNKELQELVDDIEIHPERYIHFSVFGAKSKGVKLTSKEEQKLRTMLDSTNSR
jgi:phospholipid/cholesterol/gamma-HCH transport system substrate-binding protein